MNIEVEVKAKVKDIEKAIAYGKEQGKLIKKKHQIDKYFNHPTRDFTKQINVKEYLRVRYNGEKSSLDYHVCPMKNGEMEFTQEFESKISNPEVTEEMLLKLGFIPLVIVDKKRKKFKSNDFEITIDEIKDLGFFVEVEAKKDFGGIRKSKEECIKILKIIDPEVEIVKGEGYPDMLLKKYN